MADDITHLKPEIMWKYFHEISQIPRCSKDEKAVGDYIVSVADRFGLEYINDEVGNVVIRKPATPGHENAPILVMQAHMDMVCEKDSDKVHDFSKDPIEFLIKGEWLYADRTTLGADNGIGIAAMLAIIEDGSLVHGPLEFLITVDEETGMTGAFAMSGDLLQGRIIINMDSEEEGTVYIGCAGGGDTTYVLPVDRVDSSGCDCTALKLVAHGMKGGHSGVDIHEGRANANKCLARILNLGNQATTSGVHLAAFDGGSKRNAIPRDAKAVVLVDSGDVEAFRKAASCEAENVKFEFNTIDPGFVLDIDTVEVPAKVVDRETTGQIIKMLTAIPHGVLAMSLDIPDLVETSTNCAVINLEEDHLRIWVSTRSSIKSALEWGRSIHDAIGKLVGARMTHGETYPGWKPNLESGILKIVSDVYLELFGADPQKKAIHAGLECGLIIEKFPGMDAVSIGPQIEHPHSPTERVKIPSVAKFYRYISGVLKKVAQG